MYMWEEYVVKVIVCWFGSMVVAIILIKLSGFVGMEAFIMGMLVGAIGMALGVLWTRGEIWNR